MATACAVRPACPFPAQSLEHPRCVNKACHRTRCGAVPWALRVCRIARELPAQLVPRRSFFSAAPPQVHRTWPRYWTLSTLLEAEIPAWSDQADHRSHDTEHCLVSWSCRCCSKSAHLPLTRPCTRSVHGARAAAVLCSECGKRGEEVNERRRSKWVWWLRCGVCTQGPPLGLPWHPDSRVSTTEPLKWPEAVPSGQRDS